MKIRQSCLIALTLTLFSALGCSSSSVVHTILPPQGSLAQYRTLQINAIENDMPETIDWTVANDIINLSVSKIIDLKRFNNVTVANDIRLSKEVMEKVNGIQPIDGHSGSAVLKTRLINYDKGSKFLQTAFGTGPAKITFEFTVVDKTTDKEIMKMSIESPINTIVSSPQDIVSPSSYVIKDFVHNNFN